MASAQIAVVACDDLIDIAGHPLASEVARTADGIIVVLSFALEAEGSLDTSLPPVGGIAVLLG